MFFRLNNFYNIYYDKKQKTKKLQSQALKGAWEMTARSRDQVLQRADFPMFFKPHGAVHSWPEHIFILQLFNTTLSAHSFKWGMLNIATQKVEQKYTVLEVIHT